MSRAIKIVRRDWSMTNGPHAFLSENFSKVKKVQESLRFLLS